MESINDIAIKLSVDAEGVSRGFRTAAEEARVFQKEVERLSYNVSKGDAKQFDAHVIAMQDQRTAAIKAQNDVQEEANKIIRQHMTLNERYAQQLATLVRLNNTTLVATGKQALSDAQLARAKTALTIATIRQQQAQTGANAAMAAGVGGYGGTAMALGQASYAVEDFTQVLSMGGGLNAALMSASNNLSMVVRALLGTSGAMAAVAGVAVPAVLIGTGFLIKYLMSEEEQIDLVTKAYERLNDELKRNQDTAERQLQHRFNMQDIDDLTTYAAASAKLRQETRELAKTEVEATAIEDELALKRKELRDAVAGGTIIADAQKIVDMMNQSQGVHDWMQIATAEDDVRHLTEAYKDLVDVMNTGTPDEIVRAAEEFKSVIEGTQEVFKIFPGQQTSKLSPILGTEEETSRLEDTRKLMHELDSITAAMRDKEEAIARAQENTNRLLRQENQLRQDNMRFQLSATEAQKESANIQNELAKFLGVDSPNPMMGLDPNDFSAEQVRQSAEFLELMWRDLERQKQEILDEQQRVTPIGGMEQNAFQAQADAFKQMLDAQFRQEDPQLAEIARRQGRTNDILEGMTGIRIIE